MKLTAEQIQDNWNTLLGYINTYISEDRRTKLLELYSKYSERIIMMPASHKKEYNNSFPGGYVEHVLRVIRCALRQNEIWKIEGADTSTYTLEELVFSAMNHDLGKIGTEDEESYIPQSDQWRREKLGEEYMFNNKVPFASVPDRGLFLLQSHGIPYTFNEMIAIQTHDGLYDEGNKKYLMSYLPEQKPRTSLPYIIHQADLMASRIEFEREWLNKLNGVEDKIVKKNNSKSSPSIKTKALSSIGSTEGLRSVVDNFFNKSDE